MEEKTKIVVFEWETVCGDDLSLEEMKKMGEIRFCGRPAPEEVVSLVGDSSVVICSKVRFTAEVMDACPNLSYIGLMATGYNNIDINAARERGIVVTNIPDYSAAAVCQMTMAYILQFATNLIRYDQSTRNGDWLKSKFFCYYPYPMTELQGKTLGLLGMGSIGSNVAKAAAAFGMRVIYHTRRKKDSPYEYVSREELFSQSDFLSLHCPLTEETRFVINEESLSKMKKSAFLINTARGPLVDETALAKALKEGKIAGFAGDVLNVEPQREDCPLRGLENCILTPHIAWAPKETRERLWGILEDNLRSYLSGSPKNVVQE